MTKNADQSKSVAETVIERRINLIAWAVVAAVGGWIGTSVQAQSLSLVRLETQQADMQRTLDVLVADSAHPFTDEDVTRLEGRMDSTHASLDVRIRDLERAE